MCAHDNVERSRRPRVRSAMRRIAMMRDRCSRRSRPGRSQRACCEAYCGDRHDLIRTRSGGRSRRCRNRDRDGRAERFSSARATVCRGSMLPLRRSSDSRSRATGVREMANVTPAPKRLRYRKHPRRLPRHHLRCSQSTLAARCAELLQSRRRTPVSHPAIRAMAMPGSLSQRASLDSMRHYGPRRPSRCRWSPAIVEGGWPHDN